MHELSNEARAILDLARDAHDPTDRDRRRLTGAMALQLGAAVVMSSSATTAAASGGVSSVAAATSAGLGTKVLVSIAVVGLVTGGVALQAANPAARRVHDPAPLLAPAPREEAASVRARAASDDPIAPPVIDAPPSAVESAPAHERPTRVRAATEDTLAIEVGVLGSVRAALHAGEPARALSLLESHRATFARGMLREEFLAARVMALRDLGRRTEAAAALAQFVAEMPTSPLAAALASQADRASEP
jgi:hypothetical protein